MSETIKGTYVLKSTVQWRLKALQFYRKEMERIGKRRVSLSTVQNCYALGYLPPIFPLPALREHIAWPHFKGKPSKPWHTSICAVFSTDNLGLVYLVKVLHWQKYK